MSTCGLGPEFDASFRQEYKSSIRNAIISFCFFIPVRFKNERRRNLLYQRKVEITPWSIAYISEFDFFNTLFMGWDRTRNDCNFCTLKGLPLPLICVARENAGSDIYSFNFMIHASAVGPFLFPEDFGEVPGSI